MAGLIPMSASQPVPPRDPALLDRLRPFVTVVAVLSFLTTLGTTLLSVVARNLGLSGLEWSFEAAAISFLWTSFFGVLVAELRRENVALTLLLDRLRGRAAWFVRLAGTVATIWFATAMVLSGLDFAARSGFAPTPVMRLPRLIQILPLLAFAVGVLIISGSRAWSLLRMRARS
jgi:TRAP-type transport system small permease protein